MSVRRIQLPLDFDQRVALLPVPHRADEIAISALRHLSLIEGLQVVAIGRGCVQRSAHLNFCDIERGVKPKPMRAGVTRANQAGRRWSWNPVPRSRTKTSVTCWPR